MEALRAHLAAAPEDARHWPRLKRRAATAVVLREAAAGLEVLLMRRVTRPGDRWSGDISCPGGFQHPGEDILTTAMRETQEELGLDLQPEHLVGPLRLRPVSPWHRFADFSVHPYVFAAPSADPELVPDPREVDSARWFPLDAIHDPARRTSFWWWWTFARPVAIPFRLHRVVHEDYDVWGLTLRVLEEVVSAVESSRARTI
mgnify:FL=1